MIDLIARFSSSALAQADGSDAAERGTTLLKMVNGGGVIGYIIVGLSVVALALIVVHLIQIRRKVLVPPEHLVAMKLGTGRPEKDDRDAKRLLRGVPDLDVTALRSLVARFLGPLGTNRLEEVLSEIGHPAARRRYEAGSP